MTEEQQRQNRKATTPAGGGSFRPRRRCSRLIPTGRERVCASLAPRLGRKSLAANVVVFMKWSTKDSAQFESAPVQLLPEPAAQAKQWSPVWIERRSRSSGVMSHR